MPLFSCFQQFGISYLEVGLSLSWEVLCLLQKDRIWIFFGIRKNCHNGDQYFPVWNTLSIFVVPISRGISVTYLDIFWNWKNCHDGDQYFPVWNTLSMFVVPISRGISVT